ncbi:hypothetical protein FOMPIDRAFT_1060833 [Fomitopsis schrenkii]|uniref:BRCT domain-containing protein n=1 Tax=Fomitopsis schrenkii TaxID=2126942 RepID=S8FCX6_FOMSC|nr:hypothetical protein FOMPIDRAFT_1060833 [Fomitopsis schrenkii]
MSRYTSASVIDISSSPEPSWTPSRSHSLSGLTFHFVGTWATMSIEHAQHLCRANGGKVVTPSANPSCVIVGARSSSCTFKSAEKMGRRVLKESQYILMVLEEHDTSVASVGHKRSAESYSEAEAGPSRPHKSRKVEPHYSPEPEDNYPAGPDFPRIREFLSGIPSRVGGVTITRDGLTAYDGGGEVFGDEGEDIVYLLQELEDWLSDETVSGSNQRVVIDITDDDLYNH